MFRQSQGSLLPWNGAHSIDLDTNPLQSAGYFLMMQPGVGSGFELVTFYDRNANPGDSYHLHFHPAGADQCHWTRFWSLALYSICFLSAAQLSVGYNLEDITYR